MREIRTQKWDGRVTLASRHQVKCRASHENPDLAVLSTFPGWPPAQTPGKCPSGLVTGHEGCMTREMFLSESLRTKLGWSKCFHGALYMQNSNICPSSAKLLLLLNILEVLMDSYLTWKSQKTGSKHFNPSLFTHMTHMHLPPTLVLLFLQVESLSCIWFNNNSTHKKKISIGCYRVRLDQKQFFKGGFQDS